VTGGRTLRVLVTGCGGGLGRALALRLAGAGHEVLAGIRDDASGMELARHGAMPVPLDVCDDASVAAAVARAEALGGLDAVVNNAGVEVRGPLEETAVEDFRWQFEVNVLGAFRVTKAVLPGMRRRGRGRLVFVSSLVGGAARPFLGAYSAGKFALEGMAEALRAEVAAFGIGVVVLRPGRFPSGLGASGRPPADPAEGAPYAEGSAGYAAALSRLEPPGYAPTASAMARAVAEAVTGPAPGFRRPVGADAERTAALRGERPYEEFERDFHHVLGLDRPRGVPSLEETDGDRAH
jgi:NAD(P)-dependent dehydrogenase (short-subunit alcohol dehydrogenase family)